MTGARITIVQCVVLFGASIAACAGPSGAGYHGVGIRSEQLDVDGDVVDVVDDCFTLPQLLGSRIEQSYPIGPGFVLVASGTRDEVEFFGEGPAHDGSVEIVFDEFETNWSETFDVLATDGVSYRITLQNGCVFVE